MKKLKVLSALLLLSTISLVGCNDTTTSSSLQNSSSTSETSVSTSSTSESSSSTSTSEVQSESSVSVIEVEAIVITTKYTSLTIDHEDVTLQVSVDPEQVSQEVVWSSSDEAVAIVDNGVLKIKGIGKTTITATSAVDNTKSDSFELTITGTIISGVVTNYDGLPLSGVKVSIGDKETTTNDAGEYKLTLNGKEESKDLIIEKDGYTTRTIDMTDELIDGSITKNVLLYSPNDNITLTLTGSVKNVLDGNLEGAKVTFNQQEVTTDAEGLFTIANASVKDSFKVSVTKDGYIAQEKVFEVSSYLSEIEKGNKTIDLGAFDLYTQQAPINIFNRDYDGVNHHVDGQIYRTLDGLKFIYDANFDISLNSFNYELFIDLGEVSNPSDWDRSDSRDCDFSISYAKIEKQQKYQGDAFGEGTPTHKAYEKDGHKIVEVTFPYTYLKMEKNEVFGFNVISHDVGVGDRSLNLFGNDVEWYNKWSYPRVDLDNTVYQGNNNLSKLDLTANGVVSSQELGVVGEAADRIYNIKMAKDDNGIYVITDKVNKEKPYIVDDSKYHFFIDTEQTSFDRPTDNKILHFRVESGRWIAKFSVEHANSVFNNEKSGNDVVNMGINVVSKAGYLQLFVPYSVLGADFNKTSKIGIAANIEEGSNNWKGWQAPNISGYTNIPHVEEPKSFVRLDADMKLIPQA